MIEHWIGVGVLIGIGIMLAPAALRALPWIIGAVGIGAVALMMPPAFWEVALLVGKVALGIIVFCALVFVGAAYFAFFGAFLCYVAVVVWRIAHKLFAGDPRPINRPVRYLSSWPPFPLPRFLSATPGPGDPERSATP